MVGKMKDETDGVSMVNIKIFCLIRNVWEIQWIGFKVKIIV